MVIFRHFIVHYFIESVKFSPNANANAWRKPDKVFQHKVLILKVKHRGGEVIIQLIILNS